MVILGVGTDIIECLRIGRLIERHGEQFLNSVYTERELKFCQARKRRLEHFAARWAAKEAVLRALGTKWRPGMAWTDVEIRLDANALPRVVLGGAIRELARRRGVGAVLLSMSHCRAYATAFATAVSGQVST
jgi:holo-[acyl-carrier protein] synthase